MKLILALVISCLSISAFAAPSMCVTQKGVVTKVTAFFGVTIDVFDLEPYQKGDFIGSPVYKVVIEDPAKLSGVVTRENKTTKLIRTQEEVREPVGTGFLATFLANPKVIQKAEYELVVDSVTTEVVGRFKSHEDLSKNYNLVPCQS